MFGKLFRILENSRRHQYRRPDLTYGQVTLVDHPQARRFLVELFLQPLPSSTKVRRRTSSALAGSKPRSNTTPRVACSMPEGDPSSMDPARRTPRVHLRATFPSVVASHQPTEPSQSRAGCLAGLDDDDLDPGAKAGLRRPKLGRKHQQNCPTCGASPNSIFRRRQQPLKATTATDLRRPLRPLRYDATTGQLRKIEPFAGAADQRQTTDTRLTFKAFLLGVAGPFARHAPPSEPRTLSRIYDAKATRRRRPSAAGRHGRSISQPYPSPAPLATAHNRSSGVCGHRPNAFHLRVTGRNGTRSRADPFGASAFSTMDSA